MYKTVIIDAIRNQKMLSVYFKKETTGEYVTRKIAPYDVYPKVNRKTGGERDELYAYGEGNFNKDNHPVSIYLDNVQDIQVLDETFYGPSIRKLLQVKEAPAVSRNW